jgi:hypothetical protein
VVPRDRGSMHLALTNVAFIGVGRGVFTWLVPPYAGGQIGMSRRLIRFLLLANALLTHLHFVPHS